MKPNTNRWLVFAVAALLVLCGSAFSQAGSCSGMTVGQLTSLNGFVPFGISLGDNNAHAECYQSIRESYGSCNGHGSLKSVPSRSRSFFTHCDQDRAGMLNPAASAGIS